MAGDPKKYGLIFEEKLEEYLISLRQKKIIGKIWIDLHQEWDNQEKHERSPTYDFIFYSYYMSNFLDMQIKILKLKFLRKCVDSHLLMHIIERSFPDGKIELTYQFTGMNDEYIEPIKLCDRCFISMKHE